MLKDSENVRYYQHVCQFVPMGLASNFRKGDDIPTYFSHGKGSRIYDLDGNEHIDYSIGWGPFVLGHANQGLAKAMHRGIEKMCANGNHDLMAEAAELVCRHVPCADQVFFTSTGSEAVALALRVARAYTKRNMIVRFNGHYHGWHDQYLGGIVTDPDYPITQPGHTENDRYSLQTDTAGRAKHALADSFMIEWNDLQALEDLFKRYGDEIAAVHMEPIMIDYFGSWPKPGYLEGVRELCTRYGALLSFDEIITGFRIAMGGAQQVLGITPDLATFGKALGGGGAPVAAFCGRKDIMETIARREVLCAGTYNGHPVAMAAVIGTLMELAKDDGAAFKNIDRLGHRLAEGLRGAFAENKLPLIIQGFPGVWCTEWSPDGAIYNHADATRQGHGLGQSKVDIFAKLMRNKGFFTYGRLCVCAAHTEQDIEETLIGANEICRELADG